MIDRLFLSTLAFAVLAGATLAIGGEFFSHAPVVAELPRVVITGQVQPVQTSVASARTSPDSSRNSEQLR